MSSLAGALDEPVPKKVRTEPPRKVIGTHDGTFHCDEALAVYLLRSTKEYEGSSVLRSRDPAKLDTCDIVVDVGAVYDPVKNRFDHHQKGFEEVLRERDEKGRGGIKLSSAGLVYRHFGKEIIANRMNLPLHDPSVWKMYDKMYSAFIEGIDAIDNGITQYELPPEVKPRYSIRTDLSSRVSWLNPAWNEKVDARGMDQRFERASTLTGDEFMGRLDYYAKAWLPAREVVFAAFNTRKQVHASGKIILFEQFAPWKEHLFDIEEEVGLQDEEKPLYVVYPEDYGGKWRVQAIPVRAEGFNNRKSLPAEWRGLRDDILSEKSGIPGCVFVHASGFIGGNTSREGALEMAEKSMSI